MKPQHILWMGLGLALPLPGLLLTGTPSGVVLGITMFVLGAGLATALHAGTENRQHAERVRVVDADQAA